jgi:hypothetical protein
MNALLSEWASSFNVGELISANAGSYVHLPFSEEDGKNIDEFMQLMAKTVLESGGFAVGWMTYVPSIISLGRKISSVHPLKFFSHLLTKDNRSCMRSIVLVQPRKGAWIDVPMFVKTQIISGLITSYGREDKKGNLRQYINGFVEEVLWQHFMERYTVTLRDRHIGEEEMVTALRDYRGPDNFADMVRVNTDLLTSYAVDGKWEEFVSFTIDTFLG